MDFIEEFIDFLIGASEQTRQHVDAVIKEAIACSVKVGLALPNTKKYFARLQSNFSDNQCRAKPIYVSFLYED